MLNEADKQKLIELIKNGEDIPAEFKDKLFQEVAALVEAYKKTPEYVEVIKKQIIDAKSFAKTKQLPCPA